MGALPPRLRPSLIQPGKPAVAFPQRARQHSIKPCLLFTANRDTEAVVRFRLSWRLGQQHPERHVMLPNRDQSFVPSVRLSFDGHQREDAVQRGSTEVIGIAICKRDRRAKVRGSPARRLTNEALRAIISLVCHACARNDAGGSWLTIRIAHLLSACERDQLATQLPFVSCARSALTQASRSEQR